MGKLLPFLALAALVVVFSPIYFMRRKTLRMADHDLKKIDVEDWKKQKKFGSYVRLITRIATGGIFLIVSGLNIVAIDGWPVFYAIGGLSLVTWGLLGFRKEMAEIGSLN
jgi:hypothetical protein